MGSHRLTTLAFRARNSIIIIFCLSYSRVLELEETTSLKKWTTYHRMHPRPGIVILLKGQISKVMALIYMLKRPDLVNLLEKLTPIARQRSLAFLKGIELLKLME